MPVLFMWIFSVLHGILGKSSLGALLRERRVTGRDASLPAPLLSAFGILVARGTVGALPQTPQGTLSLDPARGRRKGTKSPLDPFSRLSWSRFHAPSACSFLVLRLSPCLLPQKLSAKNHFLLRIFLRAAKQHRQYTVLRGCVKLHPVRQQIHKREVAVIAHGGIKKLRHIHRALLAVQRPLLDLQRQRQRGVVERRRYLTHPAAVPEAVRADIRRKLIAV